MIKKATLGALCATLLAGTTACGSNDTQPSIAGVGTGGTGAAPGGGGSGNAPSGGHSGTTASGGRAASGGSPGMFGTGGSPNATGGSSGIAGGMTTSAGGSAGLTSGSGGTNGLAGMSAGGRPSFGGAGTPGAAGTGITGGAGAAQMGNSAFTIKVQLASDVKPTAPTTVGIVTWSVAATGITEAHIDFGLDTTYGMTAPVDLTQMDYRTLLLGMKPAKTYHFRITASDGTTTYASDDQTVTTGAKSTANPITSFSVKDATSLTKGFFITSFWQGTNSKLPFIFDTDGDIVWWYTAGSGESTDGISRARFSADSQSIWLVNEALTGSPLRRVSIDGLTTQTYSNTKASHDIAAVSADTMAYLDYSESDCNSIFEINNGGTTKEVFEPTGIVNGTSFPTCHGNSVRYSKKEDVYSYSDWQQDVFIVDRTGKVEWRLGQKVMGGNQSWGSAQHGQQLLDSSILIYANNAAGTSKSQAIEYGLDGTLIKKFASNGGATNFGDVQRLANGNTVITYSTSSLMQEVDKNDTVVLEVKGSGSFGYVEFRESLYGLPIDIQQ